MNIKSLLLINSLALLLIASAVTPALCLQGSELIEEEITIQKERLKALDQDIKKQRRKAVRVEKSRITILTELQELDWKIEEQWQRLQQVKKEWSAAELELEITRQEIAKNEREVQELKKYIEARLIALREMGMVGTLNVLFEATSLPDLMAREQYLKLILKHDRQKRMEYYRVLTELEDKRGSLEKENQALMKLSREVEQQALLLETRKEEKAAFLEELERQGEKYAAMVRELQQAKKALQGLIDKLNQELVLQTGPSEADLFDFPSQKGKLNPPVMGAPVPVYSSRGHVVRGMTIAVPWGTEIRAIFDGTVIYNNSLPGYGQVIIIDHGDHYMSLTAQGARFFKNEGDEVMEGDVIGISGGGPWVKEGIYFELRHGKKQENPLVWFDLRGTGRVPHGAE